MTKQQLGRRIFELRTQAGITQEAAARACGISPQGWQRWEHGTNLPQATRMARIASAINVPVAAIYAEDDTRAIADVVVTRAALARIRANGDPELHALALRLTEQLTTALSHAAVSDADTEQPRPRARPARVPPKRRSKRRQAGIQSA